MISLASWIVWLHLLGIAAWLGGAAVQLLVILPAVGAEGEMASAARRAHFLTSRAMEAVIITGILNLLLRGMGSDWVFSRGFMAMLTIKLVLVAVMVGLQVWMGLAWKAEGVPVHIAVRRARASLTLQLLLGAAAVLLGLGVRSV
jgi:hypothetical protein